MFLNVIDYKVAERDEYREKFQAIRDKCGKEIQNRPLSNTTYFDYSLKELGGDYCKDCGQARKKWTLDKVN